MVIGRAITYLEKTTSTMNEALTLVQSNAPTGTIVRYQRNPGVPMVYNSIRLSQIAKQTGLVEEIDENGQAQHIRIYM